MPAPLLLIPLLLKTVCAGGIALGSGYVIKKGIDAYDKSSKRKHKDKQTKYGIKGKELDLERKNIEKFQAEKDDWKKKYDELDDRMKKRDEEIKKFQTKLRDPNLSTDERNKINSQLALLLTQQEDDKKDKDDISSKMKQLDENIKNSQKIISNTLSNLDEKHWIKEFLTLENILIIAGVYVMYKILKEDNK